MIHRPLRPLRSEPKAWAIPFLAALISATPAFSEDALSGLRFESETIPNVIDKEAEEQQERLAAYTQVLAEECDRMYVVDRFLAVTTPACANLFILRGLPELKQDTEVLAAARECLANARRADPEARHLVKNQLWGLLRIISRAHHNGNVTEEDAEEFFELAYQCSRWVHPRGDTVFLSNLATEAAKFGLELNAN